MLRIVQQQVDNLVRNAPASLMLQYGTLSLNVVIHSLAILALTEGSVAPCFAFLSGLQYHQQRWVRLQMVNCNQMPPLHTAAVYNSFIGVKVQHPVMVSQKSPRRLWARRVVLGSPCASSAINCARTRRTRGRVISGGAFRGAGQALAPARGAPSGSRELRRCMAGQGWVGCRFEGTNCLVMAERYGTASGEGNKCNAPALPSVTIPQLCGRMAHNAVIVISAVPYQGPNHMCHTPERPEGCRHWAATKGA